MPRVLDPSARRRTRRGPMLPVFVVVLLAAACARQPDDLITVTPLSVPSARVPPTLGVARGSDAVFVEPSAPAPRSGGEQVARSAAGAILYPIAGGLALAVMAPPAAILAVPVGVAAGLGAGLAEGARALAQDVHSPQEAEAAVATVRRLLNPVRLGDCLSDTLVARSAGRLVPAGTTRPVLRVQVNHVALSMQRDPTIIGGGNTPMVLTLSFSAQIMDSADGAGPSGAQAGLWHWRAEPRRYFAATAEQGRMLNADVGIAVGVVAQRMLAELYPGAFQPPPARHGREAEGFRATCPDLAPAAAAGQSAPAEGVAPRG
jgi:hypothetical protein